MATVPRIVNGAITLIPRTLALLMGTTGPVGLPVASSSARVPGMDGDVAALATADSAIAAGTAIAVATGTAIAAATAAESTLTVEHHMDTRAVEDTTAAMAAEAMWAASRVAADSTAAVAADFTAVAVVTGKTN